MLPSFTGSSRQSSRAARAGATSRRTHVSCSRKWPDRRCGIVPPATSSLPTFLHLQRAIQREAHWFPAPRNASAATRCAKCSLTSMQQKIHTEENAERATTRIYKRLPRLRRLHARRPAAMQTGAMSRSMLEKRTGESDRNVSHVTCLTAPGSMQVNAQRVIHR